MKKRGCRIATEEERKTLWEAEDRFTAAFGPGVVMVDKDGKLAAWFMELPDHCCC